jgi:hypothetical protein
MKEYTHIKPLLLEAIDAPGGQAAGIVTGPLAGFFRQTTRSQSPIVATVTTTGSFKQPGCKRLNLHLKQGDVQTASGEMRNFEVSYGLNLCRNGEAPQAG